LWKTRRDQVTGLVAADPDMEKDGRRAMTTIVNQFLVPGPTHFATLTFRNSATRPSIATDSFRWWLQGWRAHSTSCPISRVLWCAELQSRGTAHLHALWVAGPGPTAIHCQGCLASMGWNSDLPYFHQLKESWYCHHGIARIYPFDPTRGGGCAGYVTKYILSDECSDWGLWIDGEDY